jgi:catechol 2,3-dioxygenase-like lactoylglutathione lyase family enzyme
VSADASTDMSPDRAWSVRSIFHFTVNATNFERSLDFYTTIGFRVLRDNRDVIWGDLVARNFGMPSAQGRGALLGIGEGELETRLDLIEWLDPTLDPPPDVALELRVPRIIALRTDNVAAAYEDLSGRGITFVSTPQSARRSGIVNVCCCRDPDGLLVEFIEYEPGLLGSRIEGLPRRTA